MMNGSENLFTVSVSAPGKVILHGDHAVVYGKTAISASLGLRTSIVIKEIKSITDNVINIHLPSVDVQDTINLQPIVEKLFKPMLKPSVTGKFSWRLPEKLDHDKHLKNVEDFLLENKPDFNDLQRNQKNALRGFLYIFSGIFGSTNLPVRSMDISMGSELTVGAGTGSSASYAVCLAGALIQLVKLKSALPGYDAFYEQSSQEFSMKDKEVISNWAYNCEKIMHGTPSGIDNATCTFGSIVQFRKGAGPRPLDIRLELRVLLVDTRVTRETKNLVGKVAGLRQRNPVIVDHIMEACDVISRKAMQVLENLSNDEEKSDIESEYKSLAELWEMNHGLLVALGVSHAALERVRAASHAAQLACKLTGAGGGGYAIILVPPTTQRSVVDSLTSNLLENGFRVKETRLGGPGVSLEM